MLDFTLWVNAHLDESQASELLGAAEDIDSLIQHLKESDIDYRISFEITGGFESEKEKEASEET